MAGRTFVRRENGVESIIDASHLNELQIALEEDDLRIDAKADKLHNHPISEVVDLQGNLDALDARLDDLDSDMLSKANSAHKHTAEDLEGGTLIPSGGLTNQLLKKSANTDFAVVWGSLAKGDVGLGNVDNTSDVDKPISTATQLALTPLQTHAASKTNPHGVTKAQVGLGNVDNTSDANKPVSTAQQTALNGKSNTNHNHDGVYATKAMEGRITRVDGNSDGLSGLGPIESNVSNLQFRNGLVATKPSDGFVRIEGAFAGSGTAVTAARSDHTHTTNAIITYANTIGGSTVNVPDTTYFQHLLHSRSGVDLSGSLSYQFVVALEVYGSASAASLNIEVMIGDQIYLSGAFEADQGVDSTKVFTGGANIGTASTFANPIPIRVRTRANSGVYVVRSGSISIMFAPYAVKI